MISSPVVAARRLLVAALLLWPGQALAGPELISSFPAAGEIPANTLKLYLTFSEPMARGQVRRSIRLARADGDIVENPFLNLGTELWDARQRRLTLLFDPGRIKQGVGPNVREGAPLAEGRSYRLVIDGGMKSAAGEPLGADQTVSYQVGAAERRALAPEGWEMKVPKPGTRDPLHLSFDRLMNAPAAERLIRIAQSAGDLLPGQTTSDGRSWQFTPDSPWAAGSYRLLLHPELEDVAGNTARAPFDAPPDTIGQMPEPVVRHFDITME